MKERAPELANHYNIRLGIFSDKKTIKELIKNNRKLYADNFGLSLSLIILHRYDGHTFKMNLADMHIDDYLPWIIERST